VLPDIDRGIEARKKGERDYFLVPDEEAQSIGAKFIVHMIWYGWSRTLFNHDLVEELLRKAAFSHVNHCAFGQTASPFPEIVDLDSRPRESLFIEAIK
jgi:hypothetical protein